jgi:hypothetical protein
MSYAVNEDNFIQNVVCKWKDIYAYIRPCWGYFPQESFISTGMCVCEEYNY